MEGLKKLCCVVLAVIMLGSSLVLCSCGVKEQPVLDPVKEQPVLDPVKEQPVLDPVKEQPVLDPVKEQPVLDPAEEKLTNIPDALKLFSVNPVETVAKARVPALDAVRAFKLEFTNPVALYAASGPGKPTSLPMQGLGLQVAIPLPTNDEVFWSKPPVYTNGHGAAFVNKGGDEKLWFAVLSKNQAVSKIVWQVSDKPLTGTKESWTKPDGLLMSGELGLGTKEFAIDFKQVYSKHLSRVKVSARNVLLPGKITFPTLGGKHLNPIQMSFYVRAFALDNRGDIIGEPGRGLEIAYGDRLTYFPDKPQMTFLYDLLSAHWQGIPSFTGEFPNKLEVATERFFDSSRKEPWHFRPIGFPKTTDTLIFQVSKTKLGTQPDNWRAPPGLVYESELRKGMPDFDKLADPLHSIPIDFNAFASDLQTTSNRVYYIRVVALSPGPQAGTVSAHYSKSVKVEYGRVESQVVYFPPPEKISPLLPKVKVVEYQPIQWGYSDWMYWYEVVRQPTYKDYFGPIVNSDALVPGLTPGTIIKLSPPKNDDDAWYEKAWNAITSFFSDLAGYVADVTNWVSNTFESIKSELVEFVASELPLIPDSWRDDLRNVLSTALDYGLISMGVPPSLPNFDELTSLGVDYLAATALEQAGVPTSELTIDAVKELGKGIGSAMAAGAKSGSAPNPMGWNFVRQYPKALYRPAYMLLELYNPHNEPTPPGRLAGRTFRHLSQSELGDANKMTLVAAYGNSKYFELYLPVKDVVIPRLLPGQRITVPIYLTEYTGNAYSFHPLVVSQADFSRMYNHFNYFEFSYSVSFELPPAQEYAKQKGLPQDKSYEYSDTQRQIYFKTDPATVYKP